MYPIFADGTSSVYISCKVKSSIESRVTWFKDGEPLNPNSNGFSLNVHEKSHNLILNSFGEYTCMADNNFGVYQKSTFVSNHGCWSTHQHQTLSRDDLQSLPIYGVSKELTDTPAPLLLKETTMSPIEQTDPSEKNNMEEGEIK